MAKRKLGITLLATYLLSFAACGDGNFFVPHDSVGPNPDLETGGSSGGLQLFHSGSDTPLSSLEGVHAGEQVKLELRGAAPSDTVSWFTTDVTRGDFLKPGLLQLRGAGSFEIHVFAGPRSLILSVHSDLAILKPTPEPIPTPLPPGQSPTPRPSTSPSPAPKPSPTPAATTPPRPTPTASPNPPPTAVPSDPFVDEVVSFDPGLHAGFGSDRLPGIVLGPPKGGGLLMGGFDVLSLGVGGVIVLKSNTPILDGAGTDFIVFENAFDVNGNPQASFAEPGEVAVSQDGVKFFSFPCAKDDRVGGYPGCAGVHPVFANSDSNDIDPADPVVAGGDDFDLQTLGLKWARYIRIRDLSSDGGGDSAGFDLDAISIVHQ